MNGVTSTVRHNALYYLSRSRRKQLGGLQMKRGRKPMIRTNSYVMLYELTIQPWEWSFSVSESWRPPWGRWWRMDELNEAGLKCAVQFAHSGLRDCDCTAKEWLRLWARGKHNADEWLLLTDRVTGDDGASARWKMEKKKNWRNEMKFTQSNQVFTWGILRNKSALPKSNNLFINQVGPFWFHHILHIQIRKLTKCLLILCV